MKKNHIQDVYILDEDEDNDRDNDDDDDDDRDNDDDDDDILTERRSGSKLVLERLHRCLAPGETCGR